MVDLLEGPAILEDYRHAGGTASIAFLADKHTPNIAIFGACVTRVTEPNFRASDYQLVTNRSEEGVKVRK